MPLLSVAVGLALLAQADAPTTSTSEGLESDEQQIVSLLVAEHLAARGRVEASSYLVLVSETMAICPSQRPRGSCIEKYIESIVRDGRDLPDAPEDLRARFLVENSVASTLPPIPGPQVRVVARATIEQTFEGDGSWDEFNRRYPASRGFIQFSTISFSFREDMALVYVTHHFGFLGATGSLFLLRRSPAGWQVASKLPLWIS